MDDTNVQLFGSGIMSTHWRDRIAPGPPPLSWRKERDGSWSALAVSGSRAWSGCTRRAPSLRAWRGYPLAAIDRMLDFIAANETAVGQRRMVVVVTDGRDDTCGTEAECSVARQAVAEKSLATGIEIVTIGLAGGAFEDRRALSELTAASRGRSFWVDHPTQLGILFGALPDLLSYGGEMVEVRFRIQTSTAGVFRSGRTVFGTVLQGECPFECTGSAIPIAVRIP